MIEISSFTKKFGPKTALDAITFHIAEGSIFGLIGPNGAGKTTLLRSLCGIYRPDGGVILIHDKSPYEHPDVKSRICFVPDAPCSLPHASLTAMADLYRRMYRTWNQEFYLQMCQSFQLNPKQRLRSLPKGMQRLGTLICALATMPDVLLLDEVFEGLDPVIRQLIRRLISDQVAERKMTVVIASHNLRELEDFCDHVSLLHQGNLLFEQELDACKQGFHKVQALFQPPLDEPDLVALRANLPIVRLTQQGSVVTFVTRADMSTITPILEEYRPLFHETIPLSLEESFISEMEVAGYDLDQIFS